MTDLSHLNKRERIEGLRAVENQWHITLPDSFCTFYQNTPSSQFAGLHFLTPNELNHGEARVYGQLPQFFPFALHEEDDLLLGFYLHSLTPEGYWQVIAQDLGEGFLRPYSLSFETMLATAFLHALHELPDNIADEKRLIALAKECGLTERVTSIPTPSSLSALEATIISLDPQNSWSLCQYGCHLRWGNDDKATLAGEERALDYFYRAAEATPWFGDIHYLIGDIYRLQEREAKAVESWWRVANSLLSFCTRTWEWDLGIDHPDAEIYEIATDALEQFKSNATPEMIGTPLWNAVTRRDPYDANIREELAGTLLSKGDVEGAEREFLNALSLCYDERNRQAERIYNKLNELYLQYNRIREAKWLQFDANLQRKSL